MRARSQLAAVFLGLTAAAGLSFAHPFEDPRRVSAQPREALLREARMPEEARRVLVAKCADCHSDTTHWPVYARLAPGSWLMEHDVAEGREHMNLSHWLELSQDRRDVLSAEIVQQARKGAMPPPQYRILHWGARLTGADVASLALLAPGDAIEAGVTSGGDAAKGKIDFEKRCTGCHAVDSDREGPRLRGVFGSRAGTKAGFGYSDALKKSGLTWNDANLERWLADSDALVPKSAMGFSVPKARERADIVAYLKELK